MKLILKTTILILALLTSFSQFAFADNTSAHKTIAGILHGLSHFPSDADKAKLTAIMEDESVSSGYQTLASAVAGINHSVGAEDKNAIAQIMKSDASSELKALAQIAVGINHVPSDDAKAALAAMQ